MHDVAIIGAGLAGLVAAWRLRAAGRDVVVLEARDRLGGRIHGIDGLEVGPSWVWDHERNVHALLRTLGLETFDHHRDGLDVYDDGERVQRGRLPRSGVSERRVHGGTPAIVQALAARAGPVRLHSPVRQVVPTVDGLRVVTDTGEVSAAHVLAALPPAAVAGLVPEAGWLGLVPTWMEDVAKVVLRYPRRGWRDQGLSGRVYAARGPLVEVHDLSGPTGAPAALFGFLPRALHDGRWRERAVAQLDRLLGAGVPDSVVAVTWWTERWTACSRSVPGDGRLLGHPRLREPLLGGRLQLISTETSGTSPGHLDGAVERAEAVAARLLAGAQSDAGTPESPRPGG